MCDRPFVEPGILTVVFDTDGLAKRGQVSALYTAVEGIDEGHVPRAGLTNARPRAGS